MEPRDLISDLAARVAAIARPHPVRVATDGVDAAGKTTFADELAPVVEALGRPVIRASVDGFHNPAAIRYRQGRVSPEGYFHDSFNYPALIEALLEPLGPRGSLTFRRAVFDFRTDAAIDAPLERAQPNSILLLDGVFLLRPELRSYFDFSIFLRADFSVTIARAEERDLELLGSVEEVRRRYPGRYVPGQRLYLESGEPERWASVVIDNNDPQRPKIARPKNR
jgi:uridine kinase